MAEPHIFCLSHCNDKTCRKCRSKVRVMICAVWSQLYYTFPLNLLALTNGNERVKITQSPPNMSSWELENYANFRQVNCSAAELPFCVYFFFLISLLFRHLTPNHNDCFRHNTSCSISDVNSAYSRSDSAGLPYNKSNRTSQAYHRRPIDMSHCFYSKLKGLCKTLCMKSLFAELHYRLS